MKKILNYLFEYKTLSREKAKEVLMNISNGQYNEPEIAAFITVYLMRSITIDELLGFRDALHVLVDGDRVPAGEMETGSGVNGEG